MTFHEILIPVLATILPFIGLFIGKKFEKGEKQESKIDNKFNEVDERITICELKLAKIEGRINGMT